MKIISICVRSSGEMVGDRIECADNSWTRLRGLLGRASLKAGEGIWIQPSSGVHTFGMKFAIDVVGLDTHLNVVKLWPHLRPQRMTAIQRRVHSVLELAAGEIEARSIKVGQALVPRATPSEETART